MIVIPSRSWGQFLDFLEKLQQVVPAPPAPVEERHGPSNLPPEPLSSWPLPENVIRVPLLYWTLSLTYFEYLENFYTLHSELILLSLIKLIYSYNSFMQSSNSFFVASRDAAPVLQGAHAGLIATKLGAQLGGRRASGAPSRVDERVRLAAAATDARTDLHCGAGTAARAPTATATAAAVYEQRLHRAASATAATDELWPGTGGTSWCTGGWGRVAERSERVERVARSFHGLRAASIRQGPGPHRSVAWRLWRSMHEYVDNIKGPVDYFENNNECRHHQCAWGGAVQQAVQRGPQARLRGPRPRGHAAPEPPTGRPRRHWALPQAAQSPPLQVLVRARLSSWTPGRGLCDQLKLLMWTRTLKRTEYFIFYSLLTVQYYLIRSTVQSMHLSSQFYRRFIFSLFFFHRMLIFCWWEFLCDTESLLFDLFLSVHQIRNSCICKFVSIVFPRQTLIKLFLRSSIQLNTWPELIFHCSDQIMQL